MIQGEEKREVNIYREGEGNIVTKLVNEKRERWGNTKMREYIERVRVTLKLMDEQKEREGKTLT